MFKSNFAADNVGTNVTYLYSPEDSVVVETNFKPSSFERELRPLHVREIKDAMLKGVYMPAITVNVRTNNIIDGQHRWRAWLEAVEDGYSECLKVTFVDVPFEQEYDMFRFLNSALSVSNKDVFKVAVNNGITNVVKLNDFAKSHSPLTWNKHNNKAKLKFTETVIFGSPKTGYTKKHGDYEEITGPMLEYANLMADELKQIFDVLKLDLSGSKDTTFAGAWWQFRQRNPYTGSYISKNSEAVDKIGLKVFATQLKSYLNKHHGFESLNQTEWNQAFLNVTYKYVK